MKPRSMGMQWERYEAAVNCKSKGLADFGLAIGNTSAYEKTPLNRQLETLPHTKNHRSTTSRKYFHIQINTAQQPVGNISTYKETPLNSQ